MSILSSLTLSDTAKRAVSADPVTNLRNKMLAALDHQIAAFNADQQNQPYFTYTEKWQLVDEAIAGVLLTTICQLYRLRVERLQAAGADRV